MKRKIAICGGGIAGASAAAALSTLGDGYSITLLEKDSKEEVGSVRRGETLRSESTRVLSKFGFMPYFSRLSDAIIRAGEQRELYYGDAELLGKFRYDYLAPEYPVIHTSHKSIVSAAYSRLERTSNVEVNFSSQAIALSDFKDGRRKVTYRSHVDGRDREVESDLVVVADGATSRLRNILMVPTEQYDYKVGYLMFYMDHSKDLIEWGRFCLSPEGFVGVFPTGGELIRAAVELRIEELRDWLTAPYAELEGRLARRAAVLKDCRIRETGYFYHVLKRHVSKYALDGLCFLGDSAHTTHPMQAQGMSMVFNDIEALRSVLSENEDQRWILDARALSTYESKARPFNSKVMENNHELFSFFQRLCQDRDYYKQCLPAMENMGFEPAAPIASPRSA
ncbi:MAG TPA: NAD(P)/FAD-dependent oxidoreductase [Nitrososphaerales archaeon]|nr:NAD(P)/FAD-dependent oxidoreductase [Nitrososphaerales archaeon]